MAWAKKHTGGANRQLAGIRLPWPGYPLLGCVERRPQLRFTERESEYQRIQRRENTIPVFDGPAMPSKIQPSRLHHARQLPSGLDLRPDSGGTEKRERVTYCYLASGIDLPTVWDLLPFDPRSFEKQHR